MGVVSKEQGHLAESSSSPSERSARRVWVVVDDAGAVLGAAQAEAAPGVALGDGLPDDAGRSCVALSAKALGDDRRRWQVEAGYSSAQTYAVSPTSGPDRVTWGSSEGSETFFADKSDPPKPAANSAGEPLDPLPERLRGSFDVSIERNVASYNPASAVAYSCAVNSDAFVIEGVPIAPRQALMAGIEAGPYQVDEATGTTYRTVRYLLKLAPTWDQEYADRGYNEIGPDGKLREILKGAPPVRVDRPWPLSGGAAASSPTAEPAIITLRPYRQLPFSGFNF